MCIYNIRALHEYTNIYIHILYEHTVYMYVLHDIYILLLRAYGLYGTVRVGRYAVPYSTQYRTIGRYKLIATS